MLAQVAHEKTAPSNRILRARFPAVAVKFSEISRSSALVTVLSGPYRPASAGCRSPGNGNTRPTPLELMTVACCEEDNQEGIVKFSTLPSRARPWRNQRAGTATALPTPALTAVPALRTSWPRPSIRYTAAGGRNFPRTRRDFQHVQRRRPPRPPRNRASLGPDPRFSGNARFPKFPSVVSVAKGPKNTL